MTIHEIDPKTGQELNPRMPHSAYLSIGPTYGFVDGHRTERQLGIEATYMRYASAKLPAFGYGAFADLHLYDTSWFGAAGGFQAVAGVFGVELGLAARQSDGTDATSFQLHFGEFVSVGYLSLIFRQNPSIYGVQQNERSYGIEASLIAALKIPLLIGGFDSTGLVVNTNNPLRFHAE